MRNVFVTLCLCGFIIYALKKTTLKKGGKKMNNFNENDAKAAILFVKNKYGNEIAKKVEQIMRLETGNFKSKQYIQTGSAGMEVGKWRIPGNLTNGTIDFKDNNDGHTGHFIVWRSVTDFAVFLAEYIVRYKGNFARWNTTDKAKQTEYSTKVNSIQSKFV